MRYSIYSTTVAVIWEILAFLPNASIMICICATGEYLNRWFRVGKVMQVLSAITIVFVRFCVLQRDKKAVE